MWLSCPRGSPEFRGSLPDGIGAFEHHVSHDRPAHILREVAERLVESVLGERAADGAGIECHQPTVA
jgi:hypothetical protein